MLMTSRPSHIDMTVLHIVPSFFPARQYGGPIESVYQLCLHLVENGCGVRVLTTDANGPDRVLDVENEREVELDKGLRVRYCKRLMRHSVSPTLLRLLPSYIRWADVVHLTAVYSFPTIPTLFLCKMLNKPVVWSPRGALQRWDGSTRTRAKALWEWMCRVAAPKKLVLHVTSEPEAKESLRRFPGAEVVIIPNGIEIPEKVSHVGGDGLLRLLYLGRLHPKKGIENLLEACKALSDNFDKAWSLTIAGAGGSHYTETIKDTIEALALSKQVKMIGGIVGRSKQSVFENVDITVIPSHTENFGMVIAESLAHGVPVIASKGTPWSRVEKMGCGLWVGNDPESLFKAIEQMSKMPLREMGQRGREWMKKEFDWGLRAQEMLNAYKKLPGQRKRRETH